MSRAHRPHTLRLGFLLSNLRHSLGAALHLHNTGFRRGIHDNLDRRQAAQQTGMMFSLEQETKHARCSMRRADSDTTSTSSNQHQHEATSLVDALRRSCFREYILRILRRRFETRHIDAESERIPTCSRPLLSAFLPVPRPFTCSAANGHVQKTMQLGPRTLKVR
jgi:hypothetical protein